MNNIKQQLRQAFPAAGIEATELEQFFEALIFEATLVAVAAANVSRGVVLRDVDRKRLLESAGRLRGMAGELL
jgi:hypothetical protein